LRISRHLLEDARLSVGDEVNVTINNGMIVIAPVRRVRGKLSLEELVSRIPEDCKTEEMDWGEPVGREVW
jgi:antitoxin MazE